MKPVHGPSLPFILDCPPYPPNLNNSKKKKNKKKLLISYNLLKENACIVFLGPKFALSSGNSGNWRLIHRVDMHIRKKMMGTMLPGYFNMGNILCHISSTTLFMCKTPVSIISMVWPYSHHIHAISGRHWMGYATSTWEASLLVQSCLYLALTWKVLVDALLDVVQ